MYEVDDKVLFTLWLERLINGVLIFCFLASLASWLNWGLSQLIFFVGGGREWFVWDFWCGLDWLIDWRFLCLVLLLFSFLVELKVVSSTTFSI